MKFRRKDFNAEELFIKNSTIDQIRDWHWIFNYSEVRQSKPSALLRRVQVIGIGNGAIIK